jgi:hypothetical protein
LFEPILFKFPLLLGYVRVLSQYYPLDLYQGAGAVNQPGGVDRGSGYS